MSNSNAVSGDHARHADVRVIKSSGSELTEFQAAPFNLSQTRQLGTYHWRLKGWDMGTCVALPEHNGLAISIFPKCKLGKSLDDHPLKTYHMCREWECTRTCNVGRRGHISVGHRSYKSEYKLLLMERTGVTILPGVFSDTHLISAVAKLEGLENVPSEVSIRKLSRMLSRCAYNKTEVVTDILKDVGMFFAALVLLPFWIKDFKGFARNKSGQKH